jgi:hypothetical protein
MYHGVRLSMDNKKLWLNGMKDWNGELPERMTNDAQEEAFWQNMIMKKATAADGYDHYAAKIKPELLSLLEETDTVLEIGPGWGNYTFDAANKVSSFTCVDSSQSALDFLRVQAEHKGLTSMRFIHEKWERYNSEEKFDVVFGVNCYYRMQEIDQALKNMNNAANRLAIIGVTSGPEKPHLWDLYHELGYKVKFGRRDYIYLLNLLYEMGIDANCKIINLQRINRYGTEEQLMSENLNVILNDGFDEKAAKEILFRYVKKDNGEFVYPHDFKAALIYWKPESIERWSL